MSRITIGLKACHDGDAELVAGHLALKAEAVAERLGLDPCDLTWSAEPFIEGDEFSTDLPAIRTA